MTSDTQYLLRLLQQEPQTRDSVIAACHAAGRPGMVVNSRVSELRKYGHTITCIRQYRLGRRDRYLYCLVPEAVAA